jgi:hypothetical protein
VKLLLLGIFLIISFSSFAEQPVMNRKDLLLKKLTDVLVDEQYVADLKKELFFQIQAGLNLSNRAIFDEMLASAKVSKRPQLIKAYDKIEKASNEELKRELYSKINLYSILKRINTEVYSEFFNTDDLEELVRFYSTPTGKKFMMHSKAMLERTEAKSSKVLYALTLQVSEDIQTKLQRDVLALFNDEDDAEE